MTVRNTRGPRNCRGFALLVVLWAVTGISAVAVALSLLTREAVDAAGNRMGLIRAEWKATECVERVRALIDGTLWLDVADAGTTVARWNALRDVLRAADNQEDLGCTIRLWPEGAALDINSATERQISEVLTVVGASRPYADSFAAAVADWRDDDDASRARGAEVAWYQRRGLPRPRNAALAAVEELRRIRGYDSTLRFDTLFGIEPSKILWPMAPLAVLAALPGMTNETVRLIAGERRAGRGTPQPGALVDLVSASAGDTLEAHMAELLGDISMTVTSWFLRSTATHGSPPVEASLEVRLGLADRRLAVLRRRSLP